MTLADESLPPSTAPSRAGLPDDRDTTGGDAIPGPGAQPPARGRAPRAASRLLAVTERWALLGLLVAVCVFFSVYGPSSAVFPTVANIGVITGNQAVTLVVALAALLPLVCGHFDFSVGANSALCSVVCAALMSRHDAPLWAAVTAAIAVGALIGLTNGILIAGFGTNAFITTLGGATLLGGVITWYSNSQSISTGISPTLTDFGGATWFGLPRLVYLVAVLALAVWYLLAQTPFGRTLFAIGSNRRAARLVGLQVTRSTVVAFLLSGTLAGIAGVLSTARTGGSTTDTGTGLLFAALAAIFLGLTAVTPGRFNVAGMTIGLLLVTASVSGLTLSGATDWVQPVFNGAALLVAVLLSTYLARRRTGGLAI